MVDISIIYGIINQLITGGAPPCNDPIIQQPESKEFKHAGEAFHRL